MKKEFSQEEMEQVLKNDAVIPASVDEKIKETYARLGLTAAAPEEHSFLPPIINQSQLIVLFTYVVCRI